MYENFPVNIRVKLAALWTAVMFCYLYGDYFELYVPQKVEGLVNGVNLLDTPLKLFVATVLLTIPALMILVSIFLKPSISRFLNMIWGTFFTIIMLLIGVTSLSAWYAFYVFLAFTESMITALIVWQAWNWQKKA